MLITIVITVFNKEDNIEKTLLSVLNQTYKNIEIIIINDGSTDHSYEKIEKYLTHSNVYYYYHENHGVSFSRNRGIELSTGEFIFFLDGDDELLPETLTILKDHVYSDTDIVMANFIYRRENYYYKNKTIKTKRYVHFDDLESKQLKHDMFVANGNIMSSVCNKLYKRNILLNNLIKFQDNILAEDRLFNLYCYVNKPVLDVVGEYTYIINVLEDSRSRYITSFSIEQDISLYYNFRKYLNYKGLLSIYKDLLFMNLLKDIEKACLRIIRHGHRKLQLFKQQIYLLQAG